MIFYRTITSAHPENCSVKLQAVFPLAIIVLSTIYCQYMHKFFTFSELEIVKKDKKSVLQRSLQYGQSIIYL